MLIPFRVVPPQNKAREWGNPFLPRVEGYISAFKNLSTIILVHRLEKHWEPENYVHAGWIKNYLRTGWMDRRLDPVWGKIADLAISNLKGSTAVGPKTLKIITIWGGRNFGPEAVVEEVVV